MENIVVIGGGLMGTSATWKLAERGAKVTLIERQEEDYLHGSSFGTARISRSLGPKKDVFSYAHNITVKEVGNIIAFLNAENPKEKHAVEDIYTTSPVSYLFHRNQYDTIDSFRFKKQKKDFNRASQSSAFRKFGMTITVNTILVRERKEYSGTLNPTELLKKLRLGIAKKGGEIKYGHEVAGLVKKDGGFEISILNTKTKKTNALKAKKVIVAAGPYTVSILKDFAPYFNRVITPKKIAISYLKIKDERYSQLTETEKNTIHNAFPFFSQIGKEYFAVISKPEKNTSPVFKAGGHQKRRNIHDLDKVWTDEPRKKELKWIRKQFRKHFKMLEIYLSKKDIEEVKSYYCVYSDTRSKNPLITPIFSKSGSLDRNILVIGGMSGVGAKGCLCYGSLGADLMLGKEGKPNKMYRKLLNVFSNPSVNLYTRRAKRGRLF